MGLHRPEAGERKMAGLLLAAGGEWMMASHMEGGDDKHGEETRVWALIRPGILPIDPVLVLDMNSHHWAIVTRLHVFEDRKLADYTDLSVNCPHCGTILRANALTCPHCECEVNE